MPAKLHHHFPPPPLLIKVHCFCPDAMSCPEQAGTEAGRAGTALSAARWALQPQSRSHRENCFPSIYRCLPAVNAQLPALSWGVKSMPSVSSQIPCSGYPQLTELMETVSSTTLGCLLQPATYKGFTKEGKAPFHGSGGNWMLWLLLSPAGAHEPFMGLWPGHSTAAERRCAEGGLTGRISPSRPKTLLVLGQREGGFQRFWLPLRHALNSSLKG